MQIKTIFFLLLLVATVIIAVILQNQREMPGSPETTAAKNSFYLETFSLTVMTNQGSKSYTIAGDNLLQDELSGESTLTNPSSVVFRNGISDWEIKALNGVINNDQSHITLYDQVHAEHNDDQNIELDTNLLDIFLNENRIVTNDKVLITHNAGRLSGTGLVADLNKNTIELNANVKGHYAP